MKVLEELIHQLPLEYEKEVIDFVEFLIKKSSVKKGKILKQNWQGALEQYRNEYTSAELQRKGLEWRSE